jgi:hypothetical protein
MTDLLLELFCLLLIESEVEIFVELSHSIQVESSFVQERKHIHFQGFKTSAMVCKIGHSMESSADERIMR